MSAAPARILLIDDDRKLCRLVRDYLTPMGFAVEAVHDGAEGAKLAVSEQWDAVILDVMLPGLDGLEVLRKLRQESGVPVLMLTARGDEADRIVGLELGADDYLPKTFSPRELLARLRQRAAAYLKRFLVEGRPGTVAFVAAALECTALMPGPLRRGVRRSACRPAARAPAPAARPGHAAAAPRWR